MRRRGEGEGERDPDVLKVRFERDSGNVVFLVWEDIHDGVWEGCLG